MRWIPPQPTGTFKLTMIQPAPKNEYSFDDHIRKPLTMVVAIGQTRAQAAHLAGLLLNCPMFTQAVLEEEMGPGRWEPEPDEAPEGETHG